MEESGAFSALIVSSVPLVGVRIAERLPKALFREVRFASCAAEAEPLLPESDFAILFSPDEAMKRLCRRLAENSKTGILWLVGDQAYPALCREAAELGICVGTVSIGEAAVTQMIVGLMAMCARLRRAGEKNAALQQRLDDEKTLQRAKLLLIERLGMSEAAAHRYLTKTAMDRGLKLREAAQGILKTYEY